MYILESLARFSASSMAHTMMLVVVIWALFPGMVFVVGLVLESRLVPIGYSQARAFFPGDLTIGVMLTALARMYHYTGVETLWIRLPYWWAIVAVVMAVVAWRIRSGDAKHYPPRARIGPTKITHDFVGYFVVPTLLAGLGVPQLVILSRPGVFVANRLCWFAFAMAVVGYLYCTALDFLCDSVNAEDLYARHPEDWQPIWVTRKIKK